MSLILFVLLEGGSVTECERQCCILCCCQLFFTSYSGEWYCRFLLELRGMYVFAVC